METVAQVGARAEAAFEALARSGEAIDDEWQYVNDLEAVWRARLREVTAAKGAQAVSPATTEAVDRAIAEAEAIDDPHRAIDWLSTFPQVVLLALGEPA